MAKEKINKRLKSFIKEAFSSEEVFWNNEIQANRLVAVTMFIGAGVLALCWVLNIVGIFQTGDAMNSVSAQGLVELIVPAVLCLIFRGEKKWLKYVMMIEFVIVLARLDSVLGFNVVLVMAIPVVLSCRYYSKHFTAQIAALTSFLFAVSTFCGAYFNMARLDLNFYDLPLGRLEVNIETTRKNVIIDQIGIDTAARVRGVMILYFIPKFLIYSIIGIICVAIADRGHRLVLEQDAVSSKTARIESELNLASDIQANMLPNIFPAFPEHSEFDIYATMEPAKEVGGDFYDFFMIDDSHVAMVIADVSGKGVPAALFMVTAKTLIKDYTQMMLEPAEVFTRVNRILCEGNDSGLFVTGWMGVVDLKSGELKYVNAGHNPPLIKTGGEYTWLKSRPGFVLAGLDGVKYKQAVLRMDPGDRLFLYTDGVTEATSSEKTLYGEDRLIGYLNLHRDDPIKDLLKEIRSDIDLFTGDAEQFDDITMLSFEFKNNTDDDYEEITVPAKTGSLDEVTAFLERHLENAEASPKVSMQLAVALEEVFVNIANYAYPGREGEATVGIRIKDRLLSLRFKDSGIPFDPLQKEDPDITLAAEDRNIGGLGIYMVKKSMDNVEYTYRDGMNILTFDKMI